jgi:hypothetical protein
MMSATDLIAEITRSWPEDPSPTQEEIFTPHSYDDEGITEYFTGTKWLGHSTGKLRARSSAVSTFFTPKAFHYWLPAYLVAAVKDPIELSQGIDALLSALSPDSPLATSGEQSERLTLLSTEQLNATINTLAWLGEFFEEEPGFKERTAHVAAFLRSRVRSPEA